MTTKYPSLEEALEAHRRLIGRFGGAHGIRDRGALESALLRPQSGYHGSILEQAAALMESLAMNHPCIDGNKRMAFFLADAFLRANGFLLECDDQEAHRRITGMLESGAFRFANLLEWIREMAGPLP